MNTSVNNVVDDVRGSLPSFLPLTRQSIDAENTGGDQHNSNPANATRENGRKLSSDYPRVSSALRVTPRESTNSSTVNAPTQTTASSVGPASAVVQRRLSISGPSRRSSVSSLNPPTDGGNQRELQGGGEGSLGSPPSTALPPSEEPFGTVCVPVYDSKVPRGLLERGAGTAASTDRLFYICDGVGRGAQESCGLASDAPALRAPPPPSSRLVFRTDLRSADQRRGVLTRPSRISSLPERRFTQSSVREAELPVPKAAATTPNPSRARSDTAPSLSLSQRVPPLVMPQGTRLLPGTPLKKAAAPQRSDGAPSSENTKHEEPGQAALAIRQTDGGPSIGVDSEPVPAGAKESVGDRGGESSSSGPPSSHLLTAGGPLVSPTPAKEQGPPARAHGSVVSAPRRTPPERPILGAPFPLSSSACATKGFPQQPTGQTSRRPANVGNQRGADSLTNSLEGPLKSRQPTRKMPADRENLANCQTESPAPLTGEPPLLLSGAPRAAASLQAPVSSQPASSQGEQYVAPTGTAAGEPSGFCTGKPNPVLCAPLSPPSSVHHNIAVAQCRGTNSGCSSSSALMLALQRRSMALSSLTSPPRPLSVGEGGEGAVQFTSPTNPLAATHSGSSAVQSTSHDRALSLSTTESRGGSREDASVSPDTRAAGLGVVTDDENDAAAAAEEYDPTTHVGYSKDLADAVRSTLAVGPEIPRSSPVRLLTTEKCAASTPSETYKVGLLRFIHEKPSPDPAQSRYTTSGQMLFLVLLMLLVPFASVVLLLGLYYWAFALQQKPLQGLADPVSVGALSQGGAVFLFGTLLSFLVVVVLDGVIAYFSVFSTRSRLVRFKTCVVLCERAAASFQRLSLVSDDTLQRARTALGIDQTERNAAGEARRMLCFSVERADREPEAELMAAIEAANQDVAAVNADIPDSIHPMVRQLWEGGRSADDNTGSERRSGSHDKEFRHNSSHSKNKINTDHGAAATQAPNNSSMPSVVTTASGGRMPLVVTAIPNSLRSVNREADAHDGAGDEAGPELFRGKSRAATPFLSVSYTNTPHSLMRRATPTPESAVCESAARSSVSLGRDNSMRASPSLRPGGEVFDSSRRPSYSRCMAMAALRANGGSVTPDFADSTARTELSFSRNPLERGDTLLRGSSVVSYHFLSHSNSPFIGHGSTARTLTDSNAKRGGLVACRLFFPSGVTSHGAAGLAADRDLEIACTRFLECVSHVAGMYAGELCLVHGDSAVIAFNAFTALHPATLVKKIVQTALHLTDLLKEASQTGRVPPPKENRLGKAATGAGTGADDEGPPRPIPFSWGIAIHCCEIQAGFLHWEEENKLIPFITGPELEAVTRVAELSHILQVPVLSMLNNLDGCRWTVIDYVRFLDVPFDVFAYFLYNVEPIPELATTRKAVGGAEEDGGDFDDILAVEEREKRVREAVFKGFSMLMEEDFEDAINVFRSFADQGYVSAVHLLRRAEFLAESFGKESCASATVSYMRLAPHWHRLGEQEEEVRFKMNSSFEDESDAGGDDAFRAGVDRGCPADGDTGKGTSIHSSYSNNNNNTGHSGMANAVRKAVRVAHHPVLNLSHRTGGKWATHLGRRPENAVSPSDDSSVAVRRLHLELSAASPAAESSVLLTPSERAQTTVFGSFRVDGSASCQPSAAERRLLPLLSSGGFESSPEGLSRNDDTSVPHRSLRLSATMNSNSPDVNTFTEAMTLDSRTPPVSALQKLQSLSAESSGHSDTVALPEQSLDVSGIPHTDNAPNASFGSCAADRGVALASMNALEGESPITATTTTGECPQQNPLAYPLQSPSLSGNADGASMESTSKYTGVGLCNWQIPRRSSGRRSGATEEQRLRMNGNSSGFADMENAADVHGKNDWSVKTESMALPNAPACSRASLSLNFFHGLEKFPTLACELNAGDRLHDVSLSIVNHSSGNAVGQSHHRRRRSIPQRSQSELFSTTMLMMNSSTKAVTPTPVVVLLNEGDAGDGAQRAKVRRLSSHGQPLSGVGAAEDETNGSRGDSATFDERTEEHTKYFKIYNLTSHRGAESKPAHARGPCSVFVGGNCDTGQSVAIKRVPNNARHQREALIMASAYHENVIRLIGTDQSNEDYLFIVMELITSGSLGELLSQFPRVHDRQYFQPLPRATVKTYAKQLLGALDQMHRLGIAHRDISVNNIMITCSGKCKVIDFGESVRVQVKEHLTADASFIRSSAFNRDGSSVFTVPSMVREQTALTPSATEAFDAVEEEHGEMTSFVDARSPVEQDAVLSDIAQSSSPSPNRRVSCTPPPLCGTRSPSHKLAETAQRCGSSFHENSSFADDPAAESADYEVVLDTEDVNAIAGTPLFMSPQACNGIIHRKNDIWALGVVVFYCLTGCTPYPSGFVNDHTTHEELIEAIGSGKVAPELPELGSSSEYHELDETALQFVRDCLQSDLPARPTAAELLKHAFINT